VVQRPTILGATLTCTLAAFGLVAFGWADLHSLRTTPPPTDITDKGEAIAEALEAAPFVSAAGVAPAQLWAIAPAVCADCARFHRETVAVLAAGEGLVRVLVAPQRNAGGDETAFVAALAKRRDWAAYRRFADTGAMVGDAAMTDPAEVEGFAEWARASADRLATLGVTVDGPVVMWAVGDAWRIVSGPAALDAGRIQRLAAPEVSALRLAAPPR
jgi:hypothetical protein